MTAIRNLSLLIFIVPFVALLSALGATWKTIDAPGGSNGTLILAINNKDDMSGIYADDADVSHAFLLRAGSFSPIDVPDAVFTYPTGINDAGQIAGLFYKSDQVLHGFFIDGTNVTTLDFPGAKYTYAEGINNAGEVVGIYYIDGAGVHGFKWSNGGFVTIDSLSQPFGLTSINNLGDILAFRSDGKDLRTFIINSKGRVKEISHSMVGQSINDMRVIVGDIPQHGAKFNWKKKIFRQINAPNSSETVCYGVNNSGVIVGTYRGAIDGIDHGFLRTK